MEPGTCIAGRFVVERETASGGVGRIFRARDELTSHPVAVKVLGSTNRESAVRFQREAAILAELAHPGIVRYVAHGALPGGEMFLAMEWLEGEDLSKWLKRRSAGVTKDDRAGDAKIARRQASRISIADTLVLARRVAVALGALHARGLVHRDIKPGNIFLPGSAPDRAKLLDFGLARLGERAFGVTHTGMLVGTPAYMAPEQARGFRELDARVDVWALGCVLFTCLTGASPFRGSHLMAVLAKIVAEPAPRLSDVLPDAPAALDQLLTRMLAKDRALRPRDGDAVAEELAALEGISGEPSVIDVAAPAAAQAEIGSSEQRIHCVIVGAMPDGAAIDSDPSKGTSAVLHEGLIPYGAQSEVLLDGSVLVTMNGARAAMEQASRAARAALAIQRTVPGMALALASGRMAAAASAPVGPLLDRAIDALSHAAPGKIRLDPLTADLLEGRFELVLEDDVPYLAGELDAGSQIRLLLGKPAPMVGRDRELSSLEAMFAECVAEPIARAMLVTAPPGMGKTRLHRELLARLRAREEPVTLLSGQGIAESAGSPFVMIAPAIRRLAGILGGEPMETQRDKLAARLGRHLPEQEREHVVPFLGELSNVPFPDDASPALRGARKDPAVMRDAMCSAWLTWLEAECGAAPVVLLLEDLQWGDLPSIRLIDAALRALHDLPFMVLAFARPEVVSLFPQLWADRALESMRLGPLSRRASEKLARQALGRGARDEVIARIVERSEGNAFYLEELIRAVAAGAADTLPDTLLGALQARLDALGSGAKRVLRAASLFGEVFWRGGVMALLGGERPHADAVQTSAFTVDEWLDELLTREIIAKNPVAKFPGEVEYVFRHALVRSAAFAMLTEADRALGSLLVARWLERVGPPDALALAEHFMRGGESASALRWFWRAAEQALEGDDHAAAIDRAELAIRCGATGETLGALRYLQSVAHLWQARATESEVAAHEAMRLLAPGSGLWFRAAGDAITAGARAGHWDGVVRGIEQAFAATPADDARQDQIACLCCGCMQLLLTGAALSLVEPRLAALDALMARCSSVDLHVAAQVHEVNAFRWGYLGRTGEGVAALERAIACYEQAGYRRDAVLQRSVVCYNLVELGDFERAEELGRRAVLECERFGGIQLRTVVRAHLGYALLFRGKHEEGEVMLREGARMCSEGSQPRLGGSFRIYLAIVQSMRGEHRAAESEARAAIAALTAAPALCAWAQATLSRALLAQGRHAEALDAVEPAFATLTRIGGMVQGEMPLRLAHAEALEAAGETRRAREMIAAGRERVRARVRWLESAAWRESFTRHPDVARILALAEAWCGPEVAAGASVADG